MARLPMQPFNFRFDPETMTTALTLAAAAGTNLPDEVRAWLAWWTHQPGARLPRRPAAEVFAANHDELDRAAS
jgi:hypothetical protein